MVNLFFKLNCCVETWALRIRIWISNLHPGSPKEKLLRQVQIYLSALSASDIESLSAKDKNTAKKMERLLKAMAINIDANHENVAIQLGQQLKNTADKHLEASGENDNNL